MNREINWNRIILAFLIALFLFSFGILLGFVGRAIVESATISIQESTRNEILNLETITLLEDDFPCDNSILEVTSQKLDLLGGLITLLENKEGKNDETVLELKKLYTIIEVRHLYFVKKQNTQCNKNNTVIHYFYSNKEECKKLTEKNSFILNYVRNKYDNVRIYSFDIDLNSDIIKVMKEQYNITSCTEIITNGKKLQNITNSNDIEKEINPD